MSQNEKQLYALLTPTVLNTMVLAVQTLGGIVQTSHTDAVTFVTWCHAVAGQPCPKL